MRDKPNKNVILTGFMGTGKSTVGRLLAAELGYAVVDTDRLIAQRAGKPIPIIFAQDGEDVFRDWESQVTKELARERRLVIATGGGLMVSERNANLLEKSGRVFCLTATPKDILKRVKKSGEYRPLLDVDDPADRIEQLLAQRENVYGRYTQIDTSGRSPKRVVGDILKQLKESTTEKVA